MPVGRIILFIIRMQNAACFYKLPTNIGHQM